MRTLFMMVAAAVFAAPTLAADAKVALTGDNTKITFTGTKNGGKKAGDKHDQEGGEGRDAAHGRRRIHK